MSELLASIPLSAVSAADGVTAVQIVLGDISTAGREAGVSVPDESNGDEVFFGLLDSGFLIDGPTSLFAGRRDMSAIADEIGFSVGDVETHASVAAPQRFDVFSGDIALASELVEVADGVVSAGTGDDFTRDPDQVTELRLDGVPYRFAENDDFVAMGRNTSTVQDFSAGGSSVSEDRPDLAAAADTLDTIESVSAFLFAGNGFSFAFGPESSQTPASSEPFSVLGFGSSAVDGDLVYGIVYVFVDDASAERALAGIDDAWRDGELVNSFDEPTPVGDVYDVRTVERVGNTVLVRAAPVGEGLSFRIVDLALREEPLVAHS